MGLWLTCHSFAERSNYKEFEERDVKANKRSDFTYNCFKGGTKGLQNCIYYIM